MKHILNKVFSVILILFLFSVLFSCTDSKLKLSSTTGDSSLIDESDVSAPDKILSFCVNENMPVFRCDFFIKDDQTIRIDIFEVDKNIHIQSITPPENEVFTKEAAYFKDVTFIGNLSILLPVEYSAGYIRFAAYVWEEKKEMFIEIPSFSEILNPSINAQDKLIYSTLSASQTTYYTVKEFRNNKFLSVRSFGWWPADLDVSQVPNAKHLMHCEETSGASLENVINVFYVPLIGNTLDLDVSNDQIRPYFKRNSIWDLDSSKWHCKFFDELNGI